MTNAELDSIIESVRDRVLLEQMESFDNTFGKQQNINEPLTYHDALEFLRICMENSVRSSAYMTRMILESVLEISD